MAIKAGDLVATVPGSSPTTIADRKTRTIGNTDTQWGITVVSGLPNVPSNSGSKYPDIVKQTVPTQYKRGAGMDFDFDLKLTATTTRTSHDAIEGTSMAINDHCI
ncbi:hypothetical protein GT037_009213 [Alternaria burnsii]|uniref:Uncharacterized protein n=1 Tax=Alternaria burnsii TaxID=1187904 RepID=A0A8H7B0E1_9PLEO|nr:uncharacterized protein GT037_009213 [Alternaria burnsii]KAF7672712.1 hypothetical protein GT037_009213 [Alternaria burnsii]CAI9627537.1 unnamed protein product [Alternaria burnsii]